MNAGSQTQRLSSICINLIKISTQTPKTPQCHIGNTTMPGRSNQSPCPFVCHSNQITTSARTTRLITALHLNPSLITVNQNNFYILCPQQLIHTRGSDLAVSTCHASRSKEPAAPHPKVKAQQSNK